MKRKKRKKRAGRKKTEKNYRPDGMKGCRPFFRNPSGASNELFVFLSHPISLSDQQQLLHNTITIGRGPITSHVTYVHIKEEEEEEEEEEVQHAQT